MPSPLALLIMATPIVLILVLTVVLIVRRVTRRRAEKQWQTYEVQADDTIESVATAHAVGWKKLASINKLKAPYSLKKGQVLKVPEAKGVKKTPPKKDIAKKATPEKVTKKTTRRK